MARTTATSNRRASRPLEWHHSGAHLLERGTAELPEAPTTSRSSDVTRPTGAEDGADYRTDFDLIYRRVETKHEG